MCLSPLARLQMYIWCVMVQHPIRCSNITTYLVLLEYNNVNNNFRNLDRYILLVYKFNWALIYSSFCRKWFYFYNKYEKFKSIIENIVPSYQIKLQKLSREMRNTNLNILNFVYNLNKLIVYLEVMISKMKFFIFKKQDQ